MQKYLLVIVAKVAILIAEEILDIDFLERKENQDNQEEEDD